MPQTFAQFGQTIKAKHPEYADIPDEDLGRRVVAKYPQYADIVSAGPNLDNSKGEGTYRMAAPDKKGTFAAVPFSSVQDAQKQGYQFQDGGEAGRFSKDSGAAHSAMSGFTKGLGDSALGTMADVAKGAGKGLLGTALNVNDLMHGPVGMLATGGVSALTPNPASDPASAQRLHALAMTQNTAQSVGKGVEQAAEFMVPGGAEETAASMLAKVAPRLGAVAKIGAAAVGAGAVNKMQGGSFAGGATGGAVGAGITQGAKAIAPTLAEVALRVRGADRAYGATPGAAILNETTGLTPGRVAQSARQALDSLSSQKMALAQASMVPADIAPAQQIAGDAMTGAASRNNKGTIKDVSELYDQLHRKYVGGAAIPSTLPAEDAVALQRGLADLRDFSPTARSSFSDQATGQAYHAVGNAINQAVPEVSALNERTSSLIPVAKRATATDLNAGFIQRLSGKAMAHTGALTGAAIGYATHGLPGAVAGFVGPEILGSPEVQLAAARAANVATTPAAQAATKLATGGAAQAMRTGPDAWASKGADNLRAAGVPEEHIAGLQQTPDGRNTLMYAGGIDVNSKAMKAIISRIPAASSQ